MAYFTQDYLDFFRELEQNNHKEWFDENRKRYQKSIKEPFYSFIEDLIFRLNADDPDINMHAKDAVFRVNRDIRFSKDKKPYKIHMGAVVAPGGRKHHRPGIYFQCNHVDARVYGGTRMLEKEELYGIRQHIADNLNEFDRLINEPAFRKRFPVILGEKNKRLPKEFEEAALTQPVMYHKSIYYFTKLEPEVIVRDDLLDVVMENYFIMKPLKEFFAEVLDN